MTFAISPEDFNNETLWKSSEPLGSWMDQKETVSTYKAFHDTQYSVFPIDPYRSQLKSRGYAIPKNLFVEFGLAPPPTRHEESFGSHLIQRIGEVWIECKISLCRLFCLNSERLQEIDHCIKMRKCYLSARETIQCRSSSCKKKWHLATKGHKDSNNAMSEYLNHIRPSACPDMNYFLIRFIGTCRNNQANYDNLNDRSRLGGDFRGIIEWETDAGREFISNLTQTVDEHVPELCYRVQLYYDAFYAHCSSYSKLRKGVSANKELVEADKKLQEAFKPFFEIKFPSDHTFRCHCPDKPPQP